MSTIAMTIASTTAMMAMISNIGRSVITFQRFFSILPARGEGADTATSTSQGHHPAQAPVAQPQPAPHHQAEIKPEQDVAEQRAADPQMRCHRAAEITGQEDRAKNGGRRDRVENGADQRHDSEAPRQSFARTVADPVHRFRDDGPRHQLDGAVEQHEYNNETAENAAHPERGFRDRSGLSNRRHGSLLKGSGVWISGVRV